jgi:hypothetical protein
MIHEVVHAVVGAGHAVRFQERFSKAAEVAEAKGKADLAAAIRKEVGLWADTHNLRAEDIYGRIRDAVWEECDDFDVLAGSIAEDLGSTPEEFARRYRRARRVFDKARQEAIDERAHMADATMALARDR